MQLRCRGQRWRISVSGAHEKWRPNRGSPPSGAAPRPDAPMPAAQPSCPWARPILRTAVRAQPPRPRLGCSAPTSGPTARPAPPWNRNCRRLRVAGEVYLFTFMIEMGLSACRANNISRRQDIKRKRFAGRSSLGSLAVRCCVLDVRFQRFSFSLVSPSTLNPQRSTPLRRLRELCQMWQSPAAAKSRHCHLLGSRGRHESVKSEDQHRQGKAEPTWVGSHTGAFTNHNAPGF
jgi:hypothetical protein